MCAFCSCLIEVLSRMCFFYEVAQNHNDKIVIYRLVQIVTSHKFLHEEFDFYLGDHQSGHCKKLKVQKIEFIVASVKENERAFDFLLA